MCFYFFIITYKLTCLFSLNPYFIIDCRHVLGGGKSRRGKGRERGKGGGREEGGRKEEWGWEEREGEEGREGREGREGIENEGRGKDC